jgi:catechol 2,3-dioxygenase-like lactoylglutathione lyase family enzyme
MAENLTYGLTHIAIAVSDIERTKVFYQTIFDMEVMYHQEGFLQLTTPGSYDIIVFEEKRNAPIGESAGIAHFGFRLKRSENINIMITKIVDAGGVIIDKGEFVKGSPYVFFKDPDGYEIEVWYELLPGETTI